MPCLISMVREVFKSWSDLGRCLLKLGRLGPSCLGLTFFWADLSCADLSLGRVVRNSMKQSFTTVCFIQKYESLVKIIVAVVKITNISYRKIFCYRKDKKILHCIQNGVQKIYFSSSQEQFNPKIHSHAHFNYPHRKVEQKENILQQKKFTTAPEV